MPTGTNEFFVIKLKTDRAQRKKLDEFLGRAQDALVWAFEKQKGFVQAGVPLKPEEIVSSAVEEFGLDRETIRDAVDQAVAKLRAVLGGEIDDRRKRGQTMFALNGSSVMFSVFESVVSVPHLGLCGFKRNKKILTLADGASQLRMKPEGVELGYLNNEVVLRIDTVDRSPPRADFSGQKLVKVVRKPKVAES